jgi:hypothetical protein
MNANIAARINNGLIVINNDNTARSGYGGLVGLLSDNGTIESSSYIGSITVNGDTQLHTGGLVGLVEMQNSSTYASILSSRAIVNISGSGVHRGGLVGGALLNNANNMLYVTDVYTKINGISGDTTSNGGLFGRLNRVPSGALQMHNAIAIFDTTNTADGVVGTVGAQPFPDDADNSIVVINMQGDHPNEGYAVSFGSWSQFLATPTNYDAIFNGNTHSELYHDPAFQFPRFVWEYPLGTYPNLP